MVLSQKESHCGRSCCAEGGWTLPKQIASIYPGRDGQVGVALVRTASGTYRRPALLLHEEDSGYIPKDHLVLANGMLKTKDQDQLIKSPVTLLINISHPHTRQTHTPIIYTLYHRIIQQKANRTHLLFVNSMF